MNKQQFISLATNIKNDTQENRQILSDKFDLIHTNIECAHDVSEVYYMAHHILYNQDKSGEIIEFGCYKGGLSCKLSHVAKLVNKPVILFDSFIGLLESRDYTRQESLDQNIMENFELGMFASTMQETTNNLMQFGEISHCSYAPGSIEKLLPVFSNFNPSFIHIDVDIVDVCLLIIETFWNNITTELMFFHESCIIEMMNALSDNNFWQNNFGTNVPIFGNNFYNTDFSLPNTNCLNFIAKPNVQLGEMFQYE